MGFCVLIFDRQLFTTHKVGCFRRIVKNVILMIRFLAWKFTVRYSIITYNCRDNFGSIFEGERAKKLMSGKKKKKGGIVNSLLTLGIIVCLGVFAYSAFRLFTIYQDYKVGEDEYAKLQGQYTTREVKVPKTPVSESVDGESPNPTEEVASAEAVSGENAAEYLPLDVDFQALQAINPDIVGWLEIEALDISYPIVQGTDNAEYLHKTFEKQDNFAGSIFMDYANSADFGDCHTIIYGHNMKNQSMFGKLKLIKENEKYKTSRYFWIITPEGKYRYEIFSAHITPVDGDTYTLFSGPDQQFLDYANKMASESQIPKIDIPFTLDDKVVTLTTCTSNETQRFVVQGIRVSD